MACNWDVVLIGTIQHSLVFKKMVKHFILNPMSNLPCCKWTTYSQEKELSTVYDCYNPITKQYALYCICYTNYPS